MNNDTETAMEAAWKTYRLLREGEIVLETDEILDDHGDWVHPTHSVGQSAPSPLYTSHRKFRRRTENGKDADTALDDDACECGHHKNCHIYEEGACRPGFICDCTGYKRKGVSGQ